MAVKSEINVKFVQTHHGLDATFQHHERKNQHEMLPSNFQDVSQVL